MGKVKPTSNLYFLDGTIEWMKMMFMRWVYWRRKWLFEGKAWGENLLSGAYGTTDVHQEVEYIVLGLEEKLG